MIDAALEGARLRLRPILMTSFAFIFGCLPLWFATGSGAVARRVLGSTVIGGMIAASAIAIFLIPVTFYVIERLFAGRKGSVSVTTDANENRGQRSKIGNEKYKTVSSETGIAKTPKTERPIN